MIDLPEAFVDECEEIALELRGELAVDDRTRLDPRLVADHLAIDVQTIERFRRYLPEEVTRLAEEDVESFAAATVFRGTRCLILVNPSQSDIEQATSIAHELAHLELEHEPTWPLFDERGRRRSWCAEEEAEAEYLAGAMLAPRSGVEPVLSDCSQDPRRCAAHFGVSPSLMRQRVAASRRQTAAWRPSLRPVDGEIDHSALVLRRLSKPVAPEDGRPALPPG
ncbi:MAG TPA: ImmA/IrrE family metallo-endopeptidase [Solirubrobacterales bacterium]|nr:ImmA/IrrE family metallo-endopeptidase [Solirubrobacterales bacterium]